MSLKIKKLSEFAKTPTKGSDCAAGYDLFASEPAIIAARGRGIVHTGIEIGLPDPEISTRNGGVHCYGRIAPRSGLTWKDGLDVGAGVIDRDYRSEIMVILFNHTDTDYKVERGKAIAQLILELHISPLVEEVEDLDKTKRGANGFGSTDN